jgi:hypothetical protein
MLSFVSRVFVITMVLALALSLAGVFSVVAAQVTPESDVTLRLNVVPPSQLRFLRGDTITYSACIQNPSDTNVMVVQGVEIQTPDGVWHALAPPPTLPFTLGVYPDQQCWTHDWVVPGDFPRGTAVASLHGWGHQLVNGFEDDFEATIQKTVYIIIPCIDV